MSKKGEIQVSSASLGCRDNWANPSAIQDDVTESASR